MTKDSFWFHITWQFKHDLIYITLLLSDLYIENVSKQRPVTKFQQDRQKLKISTAENVKQMYEQYCRRKWIKIETTMLELINSAAVSGISNVSRPELHITQGNVLQPLSIHVDSEMSGNIFSGCERGNWHFLWFWQSLHMPHVCCFLCRPVFTFPSNHPPGDNLDLIGPVFKENKRAA